MNKISIIMPVYGVEKFIAKAIESVQKQTYEDWELIIVNDGSKDRSRAIATEYASKDNRITIVDKENGGLSDARNAGLEIATGQYINFFDSDDWAEPDFLATMIDALEKTDADLVVCGYFVDTIDGVGQLKSRLIRKGPARLTHDKPGFFTLMEIYMNYAWNKIYKSQFIKDNKLRFEKGLWLIEDCEFISRVLEYDPKIELINFAGYHYIQRPAVTLSKKYSSQTIEFIKRKIRLYVPVLKALGAPDSIADEILQEMRAYCSVYLLKQMISHLDKDEFHKEIKKLYSDHYLNPNGISLKRCTVYKEKLILALIKIRALWLLRFIGNHFINS